MADLCAAVSMECSGHDGSPMFDVMSAPSFELSSDSPNVDSGVALPGINDDYMGTGPDIGAVESH